MTRILVTGATGFIGHALIARLQRENLQIVGLSRHASIYPWDMREGPYFQHVFCDLTCESQVVRVMLQFKPDVVYHLAGNPIVKEGADPTALTSSNVLPTHTLLAYAPEGCRFVLASSATVYGNILETERCNEWSRLRPNSVYAATKVASEALVEAYTQLGRVRGVSARLVANVGPWPTHGVIHDFVQKLLSPNPVLEVLGEAPGSLKPYCHVSDTVEALVLMGLKYPTDSRPVYNIAPEDELTIEQVAELVMQGLRICKPIKWLGAETNWKGDQSVVQVWSNEIRYLGWMPKYPTSADAVLAAVQERRALMEMAA